MDFGKTISYIRKEKNIPVKNITHSMTRASYTRFIEGKNQTSVKNFVSLLNGLHITFEEFLYINRGFENDDIYVIYDKIYKLFLNNNVQDLQNTLDMIIDLIKSENKTNYIHTACVTQLIINAVKKEQYNQNAKKIIRDYLLNCEIWTHYELVIFNNVMFIFDIDTIDIFSKRVIYNLEKYQNMRGYGSESFRLLINILTIYINNHKLKKAKKLINVLQNFPLRNDMLFEKNIKILYTGLVEHLAGNENGNASIVLAMNTFKNTDSTDFFNYFKKYLFTIVNEYK